MLIGWAYVNKRENDGANLFIFLFFASKEAYPIVRQLQKITVKKAQAKVVKCTKNTCWVPRNPPGHLSKCLVKHQHMNVAVGGETVLYQMTRA